MKKTLPLLLALLLLAGGATGLYLYLARPAAPVFRALPVGRGEIVATVSATGSLAAVINVQVGTQVSGTIRQILADYNAPVKKGQAIAQIDPALLEAQVQQALGNFQAAVANQEKARVVVADAKRTNDRNLALMAEDLIARADQDASQTALDSARAALLAAQAAVTQTKGALDQARTNLGYATIRSPVDGIVVSRNVDVGQTVAASFQTPTLFYIAQDLTRMEIDTSVDEADISKVREGQLASFTVDAYPETRFQGRVTQVRNSPVTSSNVVTYVVVIGVDNHDLRLKPGMTANVTLEVDRRENVLRLPAAALRFKPKLAGPAAPVRPGPPGARLVYLLEGQGDIRPVPVRTGIGDGSLVELVAGDLKEGDQVVVEQAGVAKKTPNRDLGPGGPGGPPPPHMGPRF